MSVQPGRLFGQVGFLQTEADGLVEPALESAGEDLNIKLKGAADDE